MDKPVLATPETELQFAKYSSLLDLKQRLRKAYTTLTEDSIHLSKVGEDTQDLLDDLLADIGDLQVVVDTQIAKAKPDKTIEERGYNPADRGFQGFSDCGGSCGDCGSGGGCGSSNGGCGGCNP